MTKRAVYSWQFSRGMKNALEREARREGVTLAGLLDRMVQDWLRTRRQALAASSTQPARLRAVPSIGTVRSRERASQASRAGDQTGSGRLARDRQSG